MNVFSTMMSPSINNYQPIQKKENVSTGKNILAGFAGLSVFAPVLISVQKPFSDISAKAFKSALSLNEHYIDPAQKAFMSSGLPEKGVKYVNAWNLYGTDYDLYTSKILPQFIQKLPKYIQDYYKIIVKKTLDQIKDGTNAAFIPKANTLLLNKDKLSVAAFHEMGHALNRFSKFGNVSQKLRILPLLATPILYIVAFKNKKNAGEKPTSSIDKFTTFIKNHAGKLTFMTFLPTLAEEALASYKGAKLAKPYLSPAKLKKLNVLNAKGFASYLATAIAFTLAAKTTSWVHDKIVKL